MSKKTFVLLMMVVAIAAAVAAPTSASTDKVIDRIAIFTLDGYPGQYGAKVWVTTAYFGGRLGIQETYKFWPYENQHDAANDCTTWLNSSLKFKWSEIDLPMLSVWDPDAQDNATWLRKKNDTVYNQQSRPAR